MNNKFSMMKYKWPIIMKRYFTVLMFKVEKM